MIAIWTKAGSLKVLQSLHHKTTENPESVWFDDINELFLLSEKSL